jgi:hypothetical protein
VCCSGKGIGSSISLGRNCGEAGGTLATEARWSPKGAPDLERVYRLMAHKRPELGGCQMERQNIWGKPTWCAED